MGATDGRGTVNFDRIADDYDASRGGEERARISARDVAQHLPPGDVLEIGVGTGILAEALTAEAPQMRRLAGLDVSTEMLRRARPRLPGRLIRASAQRLPLPDGAFDAVVMVHVLHLVPDMAAVLAEAARMLRRGGRVVAVHGEAEDLDDDLYLATRGFRALGGGRLDTAAGVRAAAEAAGLRCAAQHPSSPRTTRHSPVELADLIGRRSWSRLWDLDDATWQTEVVPVIDALRALPDQDRPRVQRARMTVTVAERA
jgi:SAM-dependent methyltransferase